MVIPPVMQGGHGCEPTRPARRHPAPDGAGEDLGNLDPTEVGVGAREAGKNALLQGVEPPRPLVRRGQPATRGIGVSCT
jgi:hypothetical protein